MKRECYPADAVRGSWRGVRGAPTLQTCHPRAVQGTRHHENLNFQAKASRTGVQVPNDSKL